jgi:hypothetical protein
MEDPLVPALAVREPVARDIVEHLVARERSLRFATGEHPVGELAIEPGRQCDGQDSDLGTCRRPRRLLGMRHVQRHAARDQHGRCCYRLKPLHVEFLLSWNE